MLFSDVDGFSPAVKGLFTMNALKSTLPIHAPSTFHIITRASNGHQNGNKKTKAFPHENGDDQGSFNQ
jgi:hypothetical protein